MNVSIGETYKVTVVSIKPKFAVVKYEDGSTDIVHLSKISSNYVKSVDQFLSVGDHLEALAISSEIRPYELSFKHLNLKEKEDSFFESDEPRDYYEYTVRRSNQQSTSSKKNVSFHNDSTANIDNTESSTKSIDEMIADSRKDYEEKMMSKTKRRDRRNNQKRYKNRKNFMYD